MKKNKSKEHKCIQYFLFHNINFKNFFLLQSVNSFHNFKFFYIFGYNVMNQTI